MKKQQVCRICGEPLLLTEITTDTGKKIWVYMCACDEIMRGIKEEITVGPKDE